MRICTISNYFCFKWFKLQNSSVEGVFAPQRPTHPFRIIEHDAISMQSMTSLGRVGRILAGSVDASIISSERDINSSNMSPSSQQASTSLSSNSAETSKLCKDVSKEDVRDSPVMSRTDNSNVVLQGNALTSELKCSKDKTKQHAPKYENGRSNIYSIFKFQPVHILFL